LWEIDIAMNALQGISPTEAGSWANTRKFDAARRDFTVNALFLDPFSWILYDYTSGVRDCQKRVLRCIADPESSFAEDPARILRAVRHASRSGDPHGLECKGLLSTQQQGGRGLSNASATLGHDTYFWNSVVFH
jgi:hypothetical protein